MPRTARSSVGGYCYHVLNRGNGRATVFHKPRDYQAFVALIAEAGLRNPIRLLAYCVSCPITSIWLSGRSAMAT